jgi:hypothetical protein
MLTLTLQHSPADPLASLLADLKQSYQSLRRGNQWSLFCSRVGLAGTITATEYTHGENGWHPHLHVLVFLDSPLDVRVQAAERRWLQRRWSKFVAKRGRYAHHQHGLTFLTGDEALSQYITSVEKTWSLGDELTRANTKKSKRGGRSIGQLLEDAGTGDSRAGELFCEYAQVTFRSNQLNWSRGLRALFGLDEQKTDEELAAEQDASGLVLCYLTRSQWKQVVNDTADYRGELQAAAASGDVAQVQTFLGSLGVSLAPAQVLPEHVPPGVVPVAQG